MRKTIPLILVITLVHFLWACSSKWNRNPNLILETTPFSILHEQMQQEKRPIAVFLYTDWCRYCLQMKRTTFRNDSIIYLLNQSYYYVPFNGEEIADVTFQSQTFQHLKKGPFAGSHALARDLGSINDQLNYPTLVLLNSQYEIIFQYPGYLSAKELKLLLQKGLTEP